MDRFEQSRRDANFDRTAKRTGAAFAVWFGICALLGIGSTIVVIWAVISVVNWLTSK